MIIFHKNYVKLQKIYSKVTRFCLGKWSN